MSWKYELEKSKRDLRITSNKINFRAKKILLGTKVDIIKDRSIHQDIANPQFVGNT